MTKKRRGRIIEEKEEKILKANEEVDLSGEPESLQDKAEKAEPLKANKEVEIGDKLTVAQRKNIERELRRYIAIAGGYVDDLPEERKERCSKLLKRIGRKPDDLRRDYSLIKERE